jgi:hypothetical protein
MELPPRSTAGEYLKYATNSRQFPMLGWRGMQRFEPISLNP